MHVEHFMTKNPVACDANEPVEGVARRMRDKGVGCVVVQRGGKVVGLVTDRQLAIGVLAEGHGADTAVEEVMTPEPRCVTLEDTLFGVIEAMRSAGVARRVPVVDGEGRLVGIVSVSDVAVIAKGLLDAVMLEETHHSMVEAKLLTGGQRIGKDIGEITKGHTQPGEDARAAPATGGSSSGASR